MEREKVRIIQGLWLGNWKHEVPLTKMGGDYRCAYLREKIEVQLGAY